MTQEYVPSLTDIRALDVTKVESAHLAFYCYHAARLKKKLADAAGDCEAVIKALQTRAADEILTGESTEVVGPYGKFTKKDVEFYEYPKNEDGQIDHNKLFQHIVDNVNAGTAPDVAFAIIAGSLKKSALDKFDESELPAGVKKGKNPVTKYSTSTKASKK